MYFFIFFFKQKTAYEMRISDWSSDVCSSDLALRKDLGRYSCYIEDLSLVDYKVRILTSGTEAVTRVMIGSRDGKGNRWSTVGVSENIEIGRASGRERVCKSV